MREWIVTYWTAALSRWPSESAAWIAHDVAVIRGLNPDALAVVETTARGSSSAYSGQVLGPVEVLS